MEIAGIRLKIDPSGAKEGGRKVEQSLDEIAKKAKRTERALNRSFSFSGIASTVTRTLRGVIGGAISGVLSIAQRAVGAILSFGRSILNFARGIVRSIFSLKGALVGLVGGISIALLTSQVAAFSTEMSQVEAVTGSTRVQMDRLTASARQLGKTTRFSATEAANAMTFLGRAGLRSNQILESVPHTLNLAVAGALDLGSAADIVTNILSGFGGKTEELERFVDVLAKTAASANTDISQLGEGMKFVAPVASSLGVSLEVTAAAMGKLSDAGLQAGLAGTGLRRVLSELESPAAKTQRILESVGLSTSDVRVSAVGLTTAMRRLRDAGLDTGQALEIFGDRGGPAFTVLKGALGPMRELAERLEDSEGAAARMAKTMADNLGGELIQIKSAFEELVQAAGEAGFTSTMRSLARALADVLRSDRVTSFAEAFGSGFERVVGIVADLVVKVREISGPLLQELGSISKTVGNVIIATGFLMADTFARTGSIVSKTIELIQAEVEAFRLSVIDLGATVGRSVLRTSPGGAPIIPFDTAAAEEEAKAIDKIQEEVARTKLQLRSELADEFAGIGADAGKRFGEDFVAQAASKMSDLMGQVEFRERARLAGVLPEGGEFTGPIQERFLQKTRAEQTEQSIREALGLDPRGELERDLDELGKAIRRNLEGLDFKDPIGDMLSSLGDAQEFLRFGIPDAAEEARRALVSMSERVAETTLDLLGETARRKLKDQFERIEDDIVTSVTSTVESAIATASSLIRDRDLGADFVGPRPPTDAASAAFPGRDPALPTALSALHDVVSDGVKRLEAWGEAARDAAAKANEYQLQVLTIEGVLRDIETPGERHKKVLADLGHLWGEGKLKIDEYRRALALANDEHERQSRTLGAGVKVFFRDYIDEATNAALQVQGALGATFQGMEDAVAGLVTRTHDAAEAFRNMANTIIGELARIGTRMAISGLANLLGGALSGAALTATTPTSGALLQGSVPRSSFVPLKAQHGGVFDGPKSGFPVMLHGHEAVIPLDGPSPRKIELDRFLGEVGLGGPRGSPRPAVIGSEGARRMGTGGDAPTIVEQTTFNINLTTEVSAIDTRDFDERVSESLPRHAEQLGILAAEQYESRRSIRERYRR